MSKKGATSANLKPCNCQNAELHCSAEQRAKYDYVRHDLTGHNTEWHRYDERSLPKCFADACDEYTQATGQKPQLNTIQRWDSKSKKYKDIPGFAPIRELVVVIKPTTTNEEIDTLCKNMQARFGMTPLAFSVHRDEGHWDEKIDEAGRVSKNWTPNLHAHLYFDIMERRSVDHKGKEISDKKRGRTIKFTDADMSRMQDIAADALKMERGDVIEKGEGRDNNNIQEFIAQQKTQEVAELIRKVNELTSKCQFLESENAELKKAKSMLQGEIASLRQEELDFKDRISSLKQEAMELESQNNAIKTVISRWGSKTDEKLIKEKKSHEATKQSLREARQKSEKLESSYNSLMRSYNSLVNDYNALIGQKRDRNAVNLQNKIDDMNAALDLGIKLDLQAKQVKDLVDGKVIPVKKQDYRHTDYPDVSVEIDTKAMIQNGKGHVLQDNVWLPVREWFINMREKIKNFLRQTGQDFRHKSSWW